MLQNDKPLGTRERTAAYIPLAIRASRKTGRTLGSGNKRLQVENSRILPKNIVPSRVVNLIRRENDYILCNVHCYHDITSRTGQLHWPRLKRSLAWSGETMCQNQYEEQCKENRAANIHSTDTISTLPGLQYSVSRPNPRVGTYTCMNV